MKKRRLIFFVIFGAFQLLLFLFALIVDHQKNNIQFLLAMQGKIWLFKYTSFFGLALLIIDAVWHMKENRDESKERKKQGEELNKLKAKMFDMQETPSTKSSTAGTDQNK